LGSLPGLPTRAGRPTERGGGRALLLAAAGILLSPVLLPWGVLGLAVEVAAVVLAVRTLRRAHARGAAAPFALTAAIGGAVAALLFVLALTFVAVFHAEYSDYQSCARRAITGSAAEDCRTEFEHAVRVRVGLR
jgi:hypothetical protein